MEGGGGRAHLALETNPLRLPEATINAMSLPEAEVFLSWKTTNRKRKCPFVSMEEGIVGTNLLGLPGDELDARESNQGIESRH